MSDMPTALDDNRKPPMSLGSKIGATVFFSFFFAMGAVFTYFVARQAYRNAAEHYWNKTDCQITSSTIKEVPRDGGYDYQLIVGYQYHGPLAAQNNPEADNQYHGTVVQPDYQGSSDYRDAQRLLDAYPVHAHVPCLVKPDDPTQAVLRAGNAWIGLVILFPLIFVAIGLAGMIAPWWRRRRLPISQAQKSARGGVVFGGLFFLIGLGFLVFKTVPDVAHIQQSRTWPTTRCVIAHSGVRSHSGKSTTYSIDVLFRYEFNGKKYASSHYDFSTSSDSGYQSKQDTVRKIPAKAKTTCYVNPADPTVAVLNRSGDVILETIFPLAFGGFGLLFMILSLRATKRSAAAITPLPANVRGNISLAAARGPVALKPRSTPIGAFIGVLIFTLFWNGFLYFFFLVGVGRQWHQPGHVDLCSTLFLIPFVLVGLVMIVVTFVAFLKLFNPTVAITLTPGAVLPGQSIQVKWHFDGRYDRLDRLLIEAICQRQLTTGSGKGRSTSTTELLKIPVLETAKALEIPAGKTTFAIPAEVKPSLEIGDDKILWSVRVKGHIQHWPAVDESFAFQVLPMESAATLQSPA